MRGIYPLPTPHPIYPVQHEDLGGPHLRHPPQSSRHRRHCQEDPPIHRQKATPSRIRRRERRMLARADVKRAADKAASKPAAEQAEEEMKASTVIVEEPVTAFVAVNAATKTDPPCPPPLTQGPAPLPAPLPGRQPCDVSWPIHYEPGDSSPQGLTHHPHHDGPLPPLNSRALLPALHPATGQPKHPHPLQPDGRDQHQHPAPPLPPPLVRGDTPQCQVVEAAPVAEEAGLELGLQPSPSRGANSHQVTLLVQRLSFSFWRERTGREAGKFLHQHSCQVSSKGI